MPLLRLHPQHEFLPWPLVPAAPWVLQELVPRQRWGCLSSILPSPLCSSATMSCPPSSLSGCFPCPSRTAPVRLWGITFTAWDTCDLSDAVTWRPQPAWGIPCSNIFLEWSSVYRQIRNTRILGTFKTEGCGDSWVCFTFFKYLFYFLKSILEAAAVFSMGFF